MPKFRFFTIFGQKVKPHMTRSVEENPLYGPGPEEANLTLFPGFGRGSMKFIGVS